MAQQPGVVFIARHGPRLDAADQSWHLSTPTPYDPPITYGGWNQSRALGIRIASLLHAREQSFETKNEEHAGNADGNSEGDAEERPTKRRRLRHRVIIHTSPFLRCLQTSIAIAAGMAQYNPSTDTANTKQKRPASASPRLRTADGHGASRSHSTMGANPKDDFAHAMAQKLLHEHKHPHRAQLRVDAFLGEWLNPQYFEGITAPPPSSMMVATAKAELMENETVEIFQSAAVTKPAVNNSLWGGGGEANGTTTSGSRESTLDDWSPVDEALPPSPSSSTRSRASTQVGGESSGRKSPFRPGSPLQPLTSTLPKQEFASYNPPTPHYAVSAVQQIPRGYVAHARNACIDVDYPWDSSRAPVSWGDGGEYGEEWSALHKRFRRGVNRLVEYYGKAESGEVDDEEEEIEDLAVVLVTHAAGCNGLIGALTGQPVLLDVGMASLTMAVRREHAPMLSTITSGEDGARRKPLAAANGMGNQGRRGSVDAGLSSIYEMKLVSSTEHLRPGAEQMRAVSPSGRVHTPVTRDSSLPRFQERTEPGRSNTNTTLGTIRRPSAVNTSLAPPASSLRASSLPREGPAPPTPPVSAGLWTPPTSRTPVLAPQPTSQPQYSRPGLFPSLSETGRGRPRTQAEEAVQDISNSSSTDTAKKSPLAAEFTDFATDGEGKGTAAAESDSDSGAEMPKPGDGEAGAIPPSLSRRLSQQGLWGSGPSGALVERSVRREAKRRWTVEQD